MIMTKMGNQPDTTKIMFQNQEITDAYFRGNKVWENEKTALAVIDHNGYMNGVSGLLEHTLSPTVSGGDNYYAAMSGSNTYQDWYLQTTTPCIYTLPENLNLGNYAGKFIKQISVNVGAAAGCYNMNDLYNATITWQIRDNTGATLWSKSYRKGDYPSTNNLWLLNQNITIPVNKRISNLNFRIVYNNYGIESRRTMVDCYFSIFFRDMNIIYRN